MVAEVRVFGKIYIDGSHGTPSNVPNWVGVVPW